MRQSKYKWRGENGETIEELCQKNRAAYYNLMCNLEKKPDYYKRGIDRLSYWIHGENSDLDKLMKLFS